MGGSKISYFLKLLMEHLNVSLHDENPLLFLEYPSHYNLSNHTYVRVNQDLLVTNYRSCEGNIHDLYFERTGTTGVLLQIKTGPSGPEITPLRCSLEIYHCNGLADAKHIKNTSITGSISHIWHNQIQFSSLVMPPRLI